MTGLIGGKINAVIAAALAGILGLGAVAVLADQPDRIPDWAAPAQLTAELGDLDGNPDVTQGNGEGAGHETCFAATEHARSVLESLLESKPDHHGLTNALQATENCGLGHDGDGLDDENNDNNDNEGNGPGTGHETCYAANAHARSVLEGLLEEKPDHHGLSNALRATENCGLGNGGDAEKTQGKPEGVTQGPPDWAQRGPPDHAAQGRPDWAPRGPPEGVPPGPPEGVPRGRPGSAGD